MGSAVWEKLTLCSPHSCILSQSICYQTLLGGVGFIWVDCSCFNNTFGALCYGPHSTSPGVLFFSTNPTNFQSAQNSYSTWGDFPDTEAVFGFLKTGVCCWLVSGELLQARNNWVELEPPLRWWHRNKPSGDRGVRLAAELRASLNRQQGQGLFVLLDRCLLYLDEKCPCLPLHPWVSHGLEVLL